MRIVKYSYIAAVNIQMAESVVDMYRENAPVKCESKNCESKTCKNCENFISETDKVILAEILKLRKEIKQIKNSINDIKDDICADESFFNGLLVVLSMLFIIK